ncbi:ER-derived vesicles protein ERV41 [Ceratobasidium theobromae]|uniref:ER-derived vesicles protein ERV41 n=1 Tax=Ceratobasidium theobromae TaxID=1582974 RepID=A0A5N5QW02_9AGAM|nr:ER-derived vesicles protein ERV41 [Ceratobasidium theobromae]
MRRTYTISLLLTLSVTVYAAGRCTSSQPCWPSSSVWSTFNTSVGGRLITPHPAAWPCHDPHYDASACAEAQKNWANSFWRSNQTGAMEDLVWESTACGINTPRNVTCKQGMVPTYAVAAESIEDVSKAVNFARKHKLKLVIKNTGHDYLGRSSGAGSLSIWTHKIGGIDFTDSFIAEGCSGDQAIPAVTLGAAAQWYDVYKAADEHNVTVAGGAARSVGAAGGWVQGGGHSPLAFKCGLGVDNVLQFLVVTADGNVVMANKCQNTDLFWALRGGGGSTWGVAIKVTYRTHPPLKSMTAFGFSINTTDTQSATKLASVIIKSIPSIADAGVRGYLLWSPPNSCFGIIFQPDGASVLAVNNTLQPVWDWVASHPGTQVSTFGSVHPTFLSFVETYVHDIAIATNVWMGSRLVPRKVLQNKSDQLAKYTMGDGAFIGSSALIVGGGAINDVDPDSTGLNPAWRKDALVSWSIAGIWPSAIPARQVRQIKAKVTKFTQEIGDLAGLNHGSYFNEADPAEPRWKQAFFGSHYSRLLKIKQQVDPTGPARWALSSHNYLPTTMSSSIMDTMTAPTGVRQFDAFPKVRPTYKSRTTGGGMMTVLVAILSFILILNDLGDYLWGWRDYDFNIDNNLATIMYVNVDLVVNMPCHFLSVDLRDASGDRLFLTDEHGGFRRDGTLFDVGQAHALQNMKTSASPQEVVSASKRSQRGLFSSFRKPSEPSFRPTYNHIPDASACRIYGTVAVKKVTANLHITTLGHGYRSAEHTDHNLMNLTHVISEFSFGPYIPDISQPLDYSFEVTQEHFTAFQYFITVVPTTYQIPGQGPLHTNQYSVTHYTRSIEHGRGTPGIFFKFDIDPLSIAISQKTTSFREFIVRLIGVIGGVWVCAGWTVKIGSKAATVVTGEDEGIAEVQKSSRKSRWSGGDIRRVNASGRDGPTTPIYPGTPMFGPLPGSPMPMTPSARPPPSASYSMHRFPSSPFPGQSPAGFPRSPAPPLSARQDSFPLSARQDSFPLPHSARQDSFPSPGLAPPPQRPRPESFHAGVAPANGSSVSLNGGLPRGRPASWLSPSSGSLGTDDSKKLA